MKHSIFKNNIIERTEVPFFYLSGGRPIQAWWAGNIGAQNCPILAFLKSRGLRLEDERLPPPLQTEQEGITLGDKWTK